jgi:hypothetical protein
MPRYDDDDDDNIRIGRFDDRPRELPQSGLGIASLFIAVVMGIGLFVLFGIVVVIAARQNGQLADNDPIAIVLGLGFIGGCAMAVIGLVLGIVGSMQPDRRGLCGILGSIFNALILLGVGALICAGLLMG